MAELAAYELKEFICLGKKDNRLERCDTCCGLTNFCGKYENIHGVDLYEVIRKV